MRGFSKHFKIGGKWVGEGEHCFTTAEIGLNHNGDVELAKKLIKTAKDCNVYAVKLQKRDIESILTERGFNRTYQRARAGIATEKHTENIEKR